MLSSHGLTVLIVDDDEARASHAAHLVRLLGSMPLVAATRETAARLVDDVDMLLIDADAFGGRGSVVSVAAGAVPHLYRCLVANNARFADSRGMADYIVAKPFTAVTLGDVLAAAAKRRRSRPRSSAPTMGP